MKPVLLVTNHVPPARVGAFAALAELTPVEFALFGGRARHGGLARAPVELPFPVRHVTQREAGALAAGGEYRAVVAGTVGRTALPAAYLGARRAGVPFVLWATLWAQPAGPAGLAGYPVLRWIYSHADAVATYGPHVSAYVRARGARRVHEAPQAVDAAFWGAPVDDATARAHRRAPWQALFVGRLEHEKGVETLLDAWRAAALPASGTALALAGDGPARPPSAVPGTWFEGDRDATEVRNFYAASHVLVIPSLPTRTFREPWGMVVNEAMHQGLPVIATDAVGAAAGGLVRDGRNGLVVAAGDPQALAGALRRLHDDPAGRERMGAAARADVAAYTHEAWARGMAAALDDAGAARSSSGSRTQAG